MATSASVSCVARSTALPSGTGPASGCGVVVALVVPVVVVVVVGESRFPSVDPFPQEQRAGRRRPVIQDRLMKWSSSVSLV
jgi:hypothetical protein